MTHCFLSVIAASVADSGSDEELSSTPGAADEENSKFASLGMRFQGSNIYHCNLIGKNHIIRDGNHFDLPDMEKNEMSGSNTYFINTIFFISDRDGVSSR